MTQNRTVRILVGLVALAVVVGAAAFAYIWFSGGSGKAETPITAPTLEASTGSDSTSTVFRIVPEDSEVSFTTHEELMGNPTTVIGKTSEVAGDILVDFTAPSNSMPGTIRINMATIATDNEFRNRALRGQILQSTQPQYEFAEFVPQTISDMPDKVTIGDPFTFKITGSLTVRGSTRENTVFDVTVTPVSETRLEGTASTSVLYTDFGMVIPNAPGVANVGPDVTLTINFVANAVSADTAAVNATAEVSQ